MGKPDNYRAKAIQLSEMAERTQFPEIARQCKQLAREYQFLANLADFPTSHFVRTTTSSQTDVGAYDDTNKSPGFGRGELP